MITQNIRLINGTSSAVLVGSEALFSGLKIYTYDALPAWITPVYLGFPSIQYLTIDSSVSGVGNFAYAFTTGGSPSIGDAVLNIEVVNLSDIIKTVTTCIGNDSKNLVWITREGGRSNYIFDQRKDYSVITGDSKSFINASNEVVYFDKGKLYDSVTVYKTGVTQDEINIIASLRTSIKAWEYNETKDTYTSIFIDTKDFDKYNTKQKFNEISLTYTYAKNKSIQNG